MKTIISILLLISSLSAQAKLNIATSTTDLEALVKAVGENHVTVFAVTKGTQDVHQIEAKPSFMVKFHDADLVVSHGLELESAWLLPLIHGARNTKINPGTRGFLEVGQDLEPIEAVKGNVTRAEGDVHPGGNPHFQLDPIRMAKAAQLIAERMGELDSTNRELYLKNAKELQKRMDEKTKDWTTRMEKAGIKEVVTYHKSFSYFCNRFGIKCDLQLEPKPGIPPNAGHILEVIGQMKARKIKLVLIENYFDDSVKGKLQDAIPGVRVVTVPVSVGGEPGIKTTDDLIERLVKVFEASAK